MTIVERMGQALAEAYGPDVEFGDQARAALRAVRPEDVSDGMVRAFQSEFELRDGEGWDEATRRAIAAAIAAGGDT